MTPDLLWKGPHIHISRVIFAISIKLMNVFVCPHSFVNIIVIPLFFYYFIFCFKFYFPIVDIIVNHPYFYYFSVRAKPITKCCDKTKKPHSDIILAQLIRCVARNIVVSKKYFFLISYELYSIVFTCFLYKTYLNSWRQRIKKP